MSLSFRNTITIWLGSCLARVAIPNTKKKLLKKDIIKSNISRQTLNTKQVIANSLGWQSLQAGFSIIKKKNLNKIKSGLPPTQVMKWSQHLGN